MLVWFAEGGKEERVEEAVEEFETGGAHIGIACLLSMELRADGHQMNKKFKDCLPKHLQQALENLEKVEWRFVFDLCISKRSLSKPGNVTWAPPSILTGHRSQLATLRVNDKRTVLKTQ